MLRVVALARHFFLPELYFEPLGIGTLIDTIKRRGVLLAQIMPIVLRPMNGEEMSRPEES